MPFEQDHQAGDEVRDRVLQPETDANAQCTEEHRQAREVHADGRQADADTDAQQYVMRHASDRVQRGAIRAGPSRGDPVQGAADRARDQRGRTDHEQHAHEAVRRDGRVAEGEEVKLEDGSRCAPERGQTFEHGIPYTLLFRCQAERSRPVEGWSAPRRS